jgi:hypothetical protein
VQTFGGSFVYVHEMEQNGLKKQFSSEARAIKAPLKIGNYAGHRKQLLNSNLCCLKIIQKFFKSSYVEKHEN